MIGRAAFTGAPPTHTLHDLVVGYFDGKYGIECDAHRVECLCLRHSPREPIQNKSVLTVGFGKTLLDDPDDDIVGDKCAGLGVLACFHAHFRTGLDRLTDDGARRDCGDPQSLGHDLRLRSFTGTGGSEENNLHMRFLPAKRLS